MSDPLSENLSSAAALLTERARLYESLIAADIEIRDLLLLDTPAPLELVQPLLEFRDLLDETKKEYDERTKDLSTAIRDAIASNGLPRYETETHIAQMMYPEPRRTIDPEKLLLENVDPAKIARATKETPVAPFLRIDRKRAPKEGS